MKHISTLAGIGLMALLVGCSSTPLVVGIVGPNPFGLDDHAANGQLEVYSMLIPRVEGNNPSWFQHADYTIYNAKGVVVKHVYNCVGYYAQSPRLINLPPGKYVVRAEAKDYVSVEVPVAIGAGRLTKVHLDDAWHPANTTKTELVSLPAGAPIGWVASQK